MHVECETKGVDSEANDKSWIAKPVVCVLSAELKVWVCFGQCRSCVRLWEPVRLFVREVSGCVWDFCRCELCRSCVRLFVPLPFSDIGQEIVARARAAEGRERWKWRGF